MWKHQRKGRRRLISQGSARSLKTDICLSVPIRSGLAKRWAFSLPRNQNIHKEHSLLFRKLVRLFDLVFNLFLLKKFYFNKNKKRLGSGLLSYLQWALPCSLAGQTSSSYQTPSSWSSRLNNRKIMQKLPVIEQAILLKTIYRAFADSYCGNPILLAQQQYREGCERYWRFCTRRQG